MNNENAFVQELEPERYEFDAASRYVFAPPDRRDFLKMLGGGIVVGLMLNETSAFQAPGRGRGGRGFGGFGAAQPRELAAWLHIDEQGEVTVYTGKVEVGQNARTSFSQSVAEELRLPVSSIRLVMGDTEVVPHDMGTFGSASSTQMAPQLSRVAAAAREALFDLAAERFPADRAGLLIESGKVIDRASQKSATFGELTKGQKLTRTIAADIEVAPVNDWKVLGTSVPKVDARAMVTGQHRYSSDVRLPGMLYGKVLRAPLLDGKLESADLSAAQSLPDVVVVRDGDFVGVAAANESLVEQALAALKAEWKYPLHAAGAELFRELKSNRGEGRGGFGGPGNQSRGSIEKGLAEADHKLDASYTIAYIAHVPLEPRAAVAEW
jgi:isoquinoline 1-oxidoreductase